MSFHATKWSDTAISARIEREVEPLGSRRYTTSVSEIGLWQTVSDQPGSRTGHRFRGLRDTHQCAMQIIPLVRAKYVYAYGAVLDRLGAPTCRLLERVGLSERVFADPEAVIPAHQAWRFIGAAAEREGIDDLGLVAGDMSIQAYGQFSQRLLNVANLNQALESFCQLARCEYSRADFYVSRSENSVWFCRGPIDGDEVERKHVELLVLTMMIATVRLAAGQDWRPPVILLQTSDARRVEDHHLFSRSTIRFGNRITAFEVPQRLLAEQLPDATQLPDKGAYDRLEHEFPRALHQVVGGMLVDGIPKDPFRGRGRGRKCEDAATATVGHGHDIFSGH